MKIRYTSISKEFNKKSILGILICLLIFATGFIMQGHINLYLNMSGLIIVLGGTLGATLLSYNTRRLVIMGKVLYRSYTTQLIRSDTIVDILVELSVKRKIKGILALQRDEEETTIAFLRQAIGLMVDGHPPDQIREALSCEMYFFNLRRQETIRILKTMANLSPSFGLVGSVVGLISLLGGIGNSDIILSSIPIALTSTLYGIILSNFFFLPFAANIREKTVQELLLQKIILEGVAAIAGNIHPMVLDRKLKSFLTPSARKQTLPSLETIRQKIELSGSSPDPDTAE
jgi:chemotaxis protein MotA